MLRCAQWPLPSCRRRMNGRGAVHASESVVTSQLFRDARGLLGVPSLRARACLQHLDEDIPAEKRSVGDRGCHRYILGALSGGNILVLRRKCSCQTFARSLSAQPATLILDPPNRCSAAAPRGSTCAGCRGRRTRLIDAFRTVAAARVCQIHANTQRRSRDAFVPPLA